MPNCCSLFQSLALSVAVLTCTVPAAHALDESSVGMRIREAVLSPDICPDSGQPLWTRDQVRNPHDGYPVHLSRFGCEDGARGAVLVAPGRTESSVEYFETALDLLDRGYGPVFVVDHRGQGLSPRLLPDPNKSHVANFEDYITDFDVVVGHVHASIPAKMSLHLLGSSMGSAIIIGFLQHAEADATDEVGIASAVLLGAMVRVNYFSFVDKPATRLNLALFSETGAYWQARLRCLSDTACTEFATDPATGAYDPATRVFHVDDPAMMTHSAERYALRNWLWDDLDWSKLNTGDDAPAAIDTGPAIGSATAQWVYETTRFNRQMRRDRNLAKMTHVPILMMTGTQDLRAYRQHPAASGRAPDLDWHRDFCDGLNDAAGPDAPRPLCRFAPVDGAYHELLKEADVYRDPVLEQIDGFFATNAPRDRTDLAKQTFPLAFAMPMSASHGTTEN